MSVALGTRTILLVSFQHVLSGDISAGEYIDTSIAIDEELVRQNRRGQEGLTGPVSPHLTSRSSSRISETNRTASISTPPLIPTTPFIPQVTTTLTNPNARGREISRPLSISPHEGSMAEAATVS